jgi:hypothetical protein
LFDVKILIPIFYFNRISLCVPVMKYALFLNKYCRQPLQAFLVFFAESSEYRAVDIQDAEEYFLFDERDDDFGIRGGVAGDVTGEF